MRPQAPKGVLTSVRSLRRCLALLLASNMVALTAQAGPAGALEIRLKDAAPDRIERQRRAAAGKLPLPGTPNLAQLDERLAAKDVRIGDPLLVRIFKEEAELEVWMKRDGRFVHFATYPICHWSGSLGPKLKEGDKQSPEGFYTVTRRLLHRSGKWPRSLNLGFPNAFDKSLARTGSYILVHGGCSSVGCFAMTNTVMDEIFTLTRAAIQAGQKHVPIHVFPFHMTDKNLTRHKTSQWQTFWSDLRDGYDSFNRTRLSPQITVCEGRYQIRDSQPMEAGRTGSPFAVCAQTAKVLRAWDQLDAIARQPALWRKLPKTEQAFLVKVAGAKRVAFARKGQSRFRSSSHIRRGINKRTKQRVACDSRKPSCKRFLAMKRRGVKRKANRSRSASRASRSNRQR